MYRWFLWMLSSILFLLFLVFLTLQTDYAKHTLTQKIFSSVSKKTDHQFLLNTVSIDWFDRVTLYEVKVIDTFGEQLLGAGQITVNYSLLELITYGSIHVEGISLADARLCMNKYSDTTLLNLLTFLSSLSSSEKKREPKKIKVDQVDATNLLISYKDYRLDSAVILDKEIFNPSWFSFHIDHMQAQSLFLHNDSLEVKVEQLIGIEQYSGLPIVSFESNFGLYPKAMVFSEMRLQTENSFLSDSLALAFNRPANLSYIKDSVDFFIRLKQSELNLSDLRFFGDLPLMEEQLFMDGQITGNLSNLDLKGMHLMLEDQSFVTLDASLIGLPVFTETFMDLQISSSKITANRLKSLLNNNSIQTGSVSFAGSMVGFATDFVAYGDINTNSGLMSTDINFKLKEPFDQSQYTGNLRLKKFKLGKLLGQNWLGTLDFQGSIGGSGLTKETASFQLLADAQNIVIENYSYDSISLTGNFKADFFEGNIAVSDERGKINGIATVDFSNREEVISTDLLIDSLNLYSFGLARKPTYLTGRFVSDLREINLNDLTGTSRMLQVKIENEIDAMELDSVTVTIEHDSLKTYTLVSDLIDVELTGDFLITELIQDFPRTVQAFASYFNLSDSVNILPIEEYSYRSQIDVNLKSLNPLFELLDVPFTLSDGSVVELKYNHNNDISFGVYAFVDTLSYLGRQFFQNELLVDASKDPESSKILALVQLESDRQQWNDKISTEAFSLEAIWSQNNIASSIKIAQPVNSNEANIKSLITLKKDTIDFKILPSELIVFDTDWNINKENHVRLMKNKVIINDLQLYNGPQLVSVDGVLSDSFLTQLNFEFVEFDLMNLSSLSPRKIGGIVDAKGRISRLNNHRPLRFESDISAKELTFEDILIGNLKGYSEWDRSVDGLYVDYAINRQNINTIDLVGYFRPFLEDQLDLQVSFDQANLKLLEPLFESMISDVDGTATGELSLTGQLTRPKLRGISTINNGSVRIDYLNTVYNFSGVARFFEQQIAFDNIQVSDRFKQRASLNGAINHRQFENIFLNVSLDYNQFELLNTNRQQNSLYYGNAYATGNMKIMGPVENILITTSATSTGNTRIYIPLIEESTAEQGSFITFKSKGLLSEKSDDKLSLSGINIDFNMDITPDAYIELIFNPRTGDIIRGRGNGNLQLTVNSSGDFDLFGNYTVTEGAYNFTTAVFNKEFQVLPGGTITWFGDPYEGVMDITATYRQLADISDWNSTQTSQKRPVLVYLDLDGPMMAPEISFKLEMADQTTTDLTTDWNRSIATINANEEELKRQVFSLLVLRKFSEETSFIVGGSTLSQGFSNSVGEFVSNQLSYWLNQYDENLEIDFDINSLSTDAFNNFQLRLAYSFLDGRLRVTRGGGFTAIVDDSDSELQSILGDWSVEYILTEDGKWRLRFFSRNNQYNSGTQGVSYQQGQETGLSFQYVTSFDEFKQIIQAGRKDLHAPTSSDKTE